MKAFDEPHLDHPRFGKLTLPLEKENKHEKTERENQGISRGLRGSSLLFVGRCLSLGISFIAQVAAVRYFSRESYGVFAVAISTVAVASVVSSFGMDKAALRLLPKLDIDGKKSRFSAAVAVMGGTSLLASLFVIAIVVLLTTFGFIGADSGNASVLLVLIWTAPANVLDSLVTSLLSVFSRPGAIFLRQYVIGPGLRLLAVLLVIFFSGDIFAFAIGQLAASLIGCGLYFVLLRSMAAEHLSLGAFSLSDVRAVASGIFRFSGTLIFGDIAYLLRGSLIVILVEYFHSADQAAGLHAVGPVARLNDIVLAAFTVLFISGASRLLASGGRASLNDLYCRTVNWTTVLSFPIFLICITLAPQICLYLFGSAYVSSAPILAMLSLGIFVNSSLGVNLRLLRAVSPVRVTLGVDALIMAAAVIVSLILIPPLGAWGGGLAILVSFLFQGIVCQIAVWKSVGINPIQWRISQTYGLVICLGIIVWQTVLIFDLPIYATIILIISASITLMFARRNELDIDRVFPEVKRFPIARWILK